MTGFHLNLSLLDGPALGAGMLRSGGYGQWAANRPAVGRVGAGRLIVQAGGSEGGLRLAGDFADIVFTVAQTQRKAVAFRDDIRRRATAAGWQPDDVKVSLGVVVLVAETENEARRRERELYGTLPLERLVKALVTGLGLPAGRFGPDDTITIDDLPDTPAEGAFSIGFDESTRA